MKERGQIFTFDMLLALILTMLIVTSSGLALGMVRSKTSDYVSRYSLERSASDAADTLVRSPGRPVNWAENIENLEVPGLATTSEKSGGVIQNEIDIQKLGMLSKITSEDYWDTSKTEVQAVRKLFGDTSNLCVTLQVNENISLNITPNWDDDSQPGYENSLEVATSTRLVFTSSGDVRYVTEPLARYYKPGGGAVNEKDYEFEIYEGELEIYNWFAVVEISEHEENRPKEVSVKVNSKKKLVEKHRSRRNTDDKNTPRIWQRRTY